MIQGLKIFCVLAFLISILLLMISPERDIVEYDAILLVKMDPISITDRVVYTQVFKEVTTGKLVELDVSASIHVSSIEGNMYKLELPRQTIQYDEITQRVYTIIPIIVIIISVCGFFVISSFSNDEQKIY